MSKSVPVGSKTLGPDNPCYLIAEIGVNHNGDIDIAKRLISIAAGAGCDAVKFQKRTPELCVPAAQRGVMREPTCQIALLDNDSRRHVPRVMKFASYDSTIFLADENCIR